MSRRPASGFTLIEVMVALAVVAVSLPALLLLLDQQIDGAAYLRERSQAQWVASNRLAEMRLATAKTGTMAAGRASGESTMAGTTWYWSTVIEETAIAGFFKVDIAIALEGSEDADSITTMSAFFAPEQPGATP